MTTRADPNDSSGQFSTAPGYGSLISKYGKVAAGFTLPTIIIVGILYSLVTSRAIFFQVSCSCVVGQLGTELIPLLFADLRRGKPPSS